MLNAGTGIDYPALVDRVLLDPEALARASALFGIVAADVYTRNHDRAPNSLRISDAGNCVRQTWADVHGKLDLPESPRGLRRMQDGARSGAWYACLIVAGIDRWYHPFTARAEVDCSFNGIPGRADVVVFLEPEPLEVVEIKRTGSSYAPTKANLAPAPEEKAPWYLTQSCAYAAGLKAETFVVLVDTPSDRTGVDLRQFRYVVNDWLTETGDDYVRLLDALLDEAPEGDAREDFRCVSCRFSDCARNKNFSRSLLEKQLAASIEEASCSKT